MSLPSTPDPGTSNHARLRMHLLIFIEQAVRFAVLLTIVQLVFHGYDRSMFWTLGPAALIVGVVMSVILGNRQWRAALATRHRRIADGEADRPVDVGTSSTSTVEVAATPADVLSRAAEAAAAVHRARVTSVDPAAGTIALTVPISWSSGGLRVLIATDPISTAVTVSSRPAPGSFLFGGSIFDNGHNAQTVDLLVAWLRSLAANSHAPRKY